MTARRSIRDSTRRPFRRTVKRGGGHVISSEMDGRHSEMGDIGYEELHSQTPGRTGWRYWGRTTTNAGSDDFFGLSVVLYGDLLAVGAKGEDNTLTTIGNSGTVSSDDNGAVDSGATYVFQRVDTEWDFKSFVKSPNSDAGALNQLTPAPPPQPSPLQAS